MAGFGTWLAAMMQPLVARILMAIGFQVVTITGVTLALDTIKGSMLGWVNQIPAAGLQMALLAGCGEGLGILLGAVATRMALWQIQNGVRVLGVGSA